MRSSLVANPGHVSGLSARRKFFAWTSRVRGDGVVVGDGESPSDPWIISSTADDDVISSDSFSRLFFVSGAAPAPAAGTVIVSLRPLVARDMDSNLASVSDSSTTDDEKSDGCSFLTVVLPALLRSLSGGVCRRVVSGGRTGTVAGTVMLSLAGCLLLGRSFMSAGSRDVDY